MCQKFLARMGPFLCMIGFLLFFLYFTDSAFGQASGKKVIRLEEIKIEGRIQKPQAFYILQRSSLNFESLELKQSFVSKIIQSIDKEPF